MEMRVFRCLDKTTVANAAFNESPIVYHEELKYIRSYLLYAHVQENKEKGLL